MRRPYPLPPPNPPCSAQQTRVREARAAPLNLDHAYAPPHMRRSVCMCSVSNTAQRTCLLVRGLCACVAWCEGWRAGGTTCEYFPAAVCVEPNMHTQTKSGIYIYIVSVRDRLNAFVELCAVYIRSHTVRAHVDARNATPVLLLLLHWHKTATLAPTHPHPHSHPHTHTCIVGRWW